jgi:tetratricopeptide (TPR) repeat protein
VTRILRITAALVFLAALVPDLRRHAGERSLYRAAALFGSALTGSAPGSDPRRLAEAARDLAAGASAALRFDPRPSIVEGAARLALGDAPGAEACFRESLQRSEKPEALVNLGRALLVRGRPGEAAAAFVRAAWLHPPAVATLPAAFREDALARARNEGEVLRSGGVARVPAVPPPAAPPGPAPR